MCKSIFSVFSYIMGFPEGEKGGKGAEPFERILCLSNLSIKIIQIVYFNHSVFQILKDDAVKVLHSICQPIWETQQWPQDWKTSVFIPIPKKGNAKERSNYHTFALIFSHTSKGMVKILQARHQQYRNQELPDVPGVGDGQGGLAWCSL